MDSTTINNRELKIPKRILGTLLNSVGSGVVPRKGLEYIAIGRNDEIEALAKDLEFVSEGGSGFRFIIGRYGSGKSFLLQLIRNHCLERGFITADTDLAPEIRLTGTKGQGVALYKQLMFNLASRSSPDGNSLITIISKWLMQIQTKVLTEKNVELNSPEYDNEVTAEIFSVVSKLENFVCGYDFANVVGKYFKAYRENDEVTKSNAVKWLRGEYTTKTEAKNDLKAGMIIDDQNWYDFLKLIAVFVRKLGYKGLVVFIDECVNLYKIPNRLSRENNYEKILSMFNDTLQGKAEGLCLIMGGTPQFLEDPRRGLYSYEALKSRLTDSKFMSESYKNLMGPVIRLERLTDDEIFALTLRLSSLHSTYYDYETKLSESEILNFLKSYLSRVGGKLITPREIIRDFISALDIMHQNPNIVFSDLVKNTNTDQAVSDAETGQQREDEHSSEEDENKKDSGNTNGITLNDIDF